jgi:hypothetical protein
VSEGVGIVRPSRVIWVEGKLDASDIQLAAGGLTNLVSPYFFSPASPILNMWDEM